MLWVWYTFPILSSIQPVNISSTSKITLVESKYYELLFLLGKIKLIFYVLSSIVVLDVVITVCFFGMFLVSIMDEKSKDVFIKLHYLNTTFKCCCGILYVLLASIPWSCHAIKSRLLFSYSHARNGLESWDRYTHYHNAKEQQSGGIGNAFSIFI